MIAKLLTGILAISLMASLIRRMAGIMQEARVEVRRRQEAKAGEMRRLRQDPRTGLYFPE